ncbi:unnamed protein product [Sphagnum compactum]
MYPVVHKDQQNAADYTLRQKGFMNFKEQPAFEHSRPEKRPRQMIGKTLKTPVHNDGFLQHTTMPESTASPPGPSKGGMQQIGCVPDMNRHTTQRQHTIDCRQTEKEKTPIPQKYAGHEGLKMKMQELLNDGHNVLNTEVVFFKGTPVEIALGMSALTPLTTEHGMGNYNGNEVDASILDKWMQPNVPTQTGSWECGWFVLKYFDMYIQQRFAATEMEFEQQLEHVSQEKEFVTNLSRVQDLMRGQWNDMWAVSPKDQVWEEGTEPFFRNSRKQQILANDIASFKAPSETPGHQEVMKTVCKHLSDVAHHAMVIYPDETENCKDMWIRGCPKNEQEMLIKEWKSILFGAYMHFNILENLTLS